MGGGEEHACGDAYGFVEVVDLSAVVGGAECHDDDEPGDGVDVGFIWVGFEGFEVVEPAVGGLVLVEGAFDFFDFGADLVFGVFVGDGDEAPGLFVGSRRSGACGEEDVFDDFFWDGFVRKTADGSAF